MAAAGRPLFGGVSHPATKILDPLPGRLPGAEMGDIVDLLEGWEAKGERPAAGRLMGPLFQRSFLMFPNTGRAPRGSEARRLTAWDSPGSLWAAPNTPSLTLPS